MWSHVYPVDTFTEGVFHDVCPQSSCVSSHVDPPGVHTVTGLLPPLLCLTLTTVPANDYHTTVPATVS